MKKSMLLSLATAGAVVFTSAATFAAWDTTSTSTTGELQLSNPTTVVSAGLASFTATGEVLNTAPTYESDITFTVADKSTKADQITLSAELTDDKDDPITTAGNFTVDIVEKGGNTVMGGVDTTIDDGANVYTVKVTPLNDTYAGKKINVKVTGVLGKQ